jgi:hypothetical protein
LDRKIFGILKKKRQTLLDLIASVYFSTRSMRLDPVSTNSGTAEAQLASMTTTACSEIKLASLWFEKKLTDRTQILLAEHIFATHIEPKPYYVQEAFQFGWRGSSVTDPDCAGRSQRPQSGVYSCSLAAKHGSSDHLLIDSYIFYHLICVVLFLLTWTAHPAAYGRSHYVAYIQCTHSELD